MGMREAETREKEVGITASRKKRRRRGALTFGRSSSLCALLFITQLSSRRLKSKRILYCAHELYIARTKAYFSFWQDYSNAELITYLLMLVQGSEWRARRLK